MLSGIDHVILACADPDAAAAELEARLGLAATGGGRHDAHGTFNRLIWLGDSFIELIGVFDDSLARQSWLGAPAAEALEASAAKYVGLALASDELATDIARLRGLGAAISDPVPGERRRPDGEIVRWQTALLPARDPDVGMCFLIEHDLSAAEWRPVDRAMRAASVHPLGSPGRLVRVELPVTDIHVATMRLLRAYGLQFRPSLAGGGARDTTLGTQTLRISRGRLPVITVRAGPAARRFSALGCDWELLPYK